MRKYFSFKYNEAPPTSFGWALKNVVGLSDDEIDNLLNNGEN